MYVLCDLADLCISLCVSGFISFCSLFLFFFSSRRRHTSCAVVTGVQTCALPICCLLAGRRNPTWSGTVDELRERLGAPSNSMPNFSDFRRLVLTPGKAEIDQLAAFTMDWVERRGARGKITHVTITFYPKD